jgi:hypothetical protein
MRKFMEEFQTAEECAFWIGKEAEKVNDKYIREFTEIAFE